MTPDPATIRARLRKEALERRDALPPERVAQWGERIADEALALVADRKARVVFSYLDVPNEVPTRALVERLLRSGCRVFVPYVTTGSPDLTLYEIRHLDSDLKRGIWGIPTPRIRRCPQRDASEVDLAFVPLVAFDDEGNRIGHGAGYYDRFLTKHPHVYRLGLAFEIQRVASCYPQPWDAPLDALLTEKGLRTFRRR
jgi:5-formyltetrahydrofolate cyclo-ligase